MRTVHLRLSVAAFVLSLSAGRVSAVTLDDVRRSLATLRGDTPATVKIDFHDLRTDKKEKTEVAGASVVEDSGTHIRIVHEKADLRRRAAKEGRPDESLSAQETFELMNYAPALLKTLGGATLKRSSQSTYEGAPATLFEIVPAREKDEDGDKWVKEYSHTVLLWTNAEGLPLGAEETLKVKARIVLIGVEFSRQAKMRFAREGDRLLVVKRTSQQSSAGMGQNETSVKTVTVTPR